EEVPGLGLGGLVAELERLVHLGVHLGLDLLQIRIAHAHLGQVTLHDVQRVLVGLVVLDLFLGAVGLRIRHGVAAEAIAAGLEQRGAVAALGALQRAVGGVVHGQRVHPVYGLARNAVVA